ncbi:MAG: hypothetical protein J6T23_07330 [Elusimicrobia bacterium]|nr:hypothetical protein [Elusimicrobiota bacterium]
MKLKIIINYVIFLLLIVTVAFSLSKLVYVNKNYYESYLLKTIYNMKPNSIDVLVIGPSTSESGWNPLVAWKEYGITSLNYSFSNLPISIIKNVITDVLKKQSPKTILIDVNSLISYNYNKGFAKIYFFYYIFQQIPISVNKIKILSILTKYYELDLETFIYSILPVTATHENAFFEDIKPTGFCLAYIRKSYFQRKDLSFNISYPKISSYQENDIPLKYIEDLFDFCDNLDIPTIFISVPAPLFFAKPFNMIPMREKYDSFFSFLKEKNKDYINTNEYHTIRDLNLSYLDIDDNDHLNFWGSKKYTKYVSEIIKEKYNLEDKRNNPDYSFWNDVAEQYIMDVKNNFGVEISF